MHRTFWFCSSYLALASLSLAHSQPPSGQPVKNPEPGNLSQLWDDLAGADAGKAYRAIWALAQSPRQAIPFFEKRLRPVVAPDVKKVEQLIKDLGSDRFAIRTTANRELENMAELAEPALRNALNGNLPLEARQRIERLLNQMVGPVLSADKLRELRAVESLEYIGTPEAQKLLEILAKGAPGARLTQEAKESLQRLARRQGASPPPAKSPKNQSRTDLYNDLLPAGAVARLGTLRFRHSGSNFQSMKIAFSPDNKSLASMAAGVFQLWDAHSGKLLRRIDAGGSSYRGQGGGNCFAFSPDGKSLAINTLEKTGATIWLWDLAAGNKRQIQLAATSLAFTPDGKTLVTSNSDGSVRIWDLAANKEIRRHMFGQPALDWVLSPDGTLMAATSTRQYQGNIHLWKCQTGERPRVVKVPGRYLTCLAFSADNKMLAVGSYEGLHLVDVAGGRVPRRLSYGDVTNITRAIAFSRDGKSLAVTNYAAKAIALLDPATGKHLRTLDFSMDPDNVVFSVDGQLLAASSGQVLRVWDLATGKPLGENGQAHLGIIRHISYSPRGTLIATSGQDGTARLWETGTGRQRFLLRHGSKEPTYSSGSFAWVLASAFSPDDKRLATSSLDDTVRLWDTDTGREIYNLAGHGNSGGHRALDFSADGRKLFSWGDDMYLRVWDLAKGKAISEHRVRPKGINIPEDDDEEESSPQRELRLREFAVSLAQGTFSPKGGIFALASRINGVHFFDIASGKEQRIHAADAGGALAFSPQGKIMLTESQGSEHALALWRLPSGKMIQKIPLSREYGEAAFTSDGKSFAAALGPQIIVWETASGKIRLTLEGYGDNARRLAFSPDGRFLTAALDNSTALIWDLAHIGAGAEGNR